MSFSGPIALTKQVDMEAGEPTDGGLSVPVVTVLEADGPDGRSVEVSRFRNRYLFTPDGSVGFAANEVYDFAGAREHVESSGTFLAADFSAPAWSYSWRYDTTSGPHQETLSYDATARWAARDHVELRSGLRAEVWALAVDTLLTKFTYQVGTAQPLAVTHNREHQRVALLEGVGPMLSFTRDQTGVWNLEIDAEIDDLITEGGVAMVRSLVEAE